MPDPLLDVVDAGAEQYPVRMYIGTITAVDLTAGECSIDIRGDGSALTGIVYIGRPVTIGQQALYVTFRRNAIVLGGTG